MSDESKNRDSATEDATMALTRGDIPELFKLLAAELRKPTSSASAHDPLEGSSRDSAQPRIDGTPASDHLAHLKIIGGHGGKSNSEESVSTLPTDDTAAKKGAFAWGRVSLLYPTNWSHEFRRGNSLRWLNCSQTGLGTHAYPPAPKGEEDKSPSRPKRKQVNNILEWVQCFNIYIAVITTKAPGRVADLLGYQTLIIQASMEYKGEGWLGYDRRFRQNAAADPELVWARVDPTLWNIAFAGQGNITRCSYCFSLTHASLECEWAPTTPTPASPAPGVPQTISFTPRRASVSARDQPVCYDWNFNRSPVCLHPNCKYQHICVYCSADPQVALFCQRRPKPFTQQGMPPRAGRPRYHPY